MLDSDLNMSLYTCKLKLSTATANFRILFIQIIQGYSCVSRHANAPLKHIQTCSIIFRTLCNSCTFSTLDYSEPCLTKSCYTSNQ